MDGYPTGLQALAAFYVAIHAREPISVSRESANHLGHASPDIPGTSGGALLAVTEQAPAPALSGVGAQGGQG